ncbi:MAG: histidine kinase [Bacteroidetes bacterium]|jgi:hypothetical protein|nr:histidine kinase [Bacteroidota bacterium]MBT6687258.1 histidine kinase [Bacteroidota bacterium]MBT7142130.1 histidine kinase [Bacteroidota bacterium]MBT7490155.1 histidine kinase [Bacteroidota bacterium]
MERLLISNNKNESFEIISPQLIQPINLPASMRNIPKQQVVNFDIDGDSIEEFIIFTDGHNSVTVLDEHLKEIHKLGTIARTGMSRKIQTQVTKDKRRFLHINSGGVSYTYEFTINPLYFWQYPIYIAIFLIFYLFFYSLNQVQNRLAKEKYEKEKQVLKLQYSSLKNQIDPHFTINVLNSISGMYDQQQIKLAEKFMQRFSNLMQQSLMNSDKVTVSLKKELEFCRNFIEVQKVRYSNCFDYSIEVDETVKLSIEIPRMIIHTFVENAIKHGLLPKREDGYLTIKASKTGKNIFIEIVDNGIGRKQAKEQNTKGTGKGIGIADEILELYKKLSGKRIKYNMTDIEENEPDKSGTKVRIEIPV